MDYLTLLRADLLRLDDARRGRIAQREQRIDFGDDALLFGENALDQPFLRCFNLDA
jgi:hypothetical protein